MKTKQSNMVRRATAMFMAVIMLLLIINKALFIHTHILEDGTVIVHAHPYNKSEDSKPVKTHHHSNYALLFFHNINLLFFISFFFAFGTFTYIVKFYFSSKKHYSYFIGKNKKDRAPPFYLYNQA